MKIKEDLMLRQINNEWMVIPMGERLMDFNGMLQLNESGSFLWKCLSEETTKEVLVAALLEEYDIDQAQAVETVDEFVELLEKEHLLDV